MVASAYDYEHCGVRSLVLTRELLYQHSRFKDEQCAEERKFLGQPFFQAANVPPPLRRAASASFRPSAMPAATARAMTSLISPAGPIRKPNSLRIK